MESHHIRQFGHYLEQDHYNAQDHHQNTAAAAAASQKLAPRRERESEKENVAVCGAAAATTYVWFIYVVGSYWEMFVFINIKLFISPFLSFPNNKNSTARQLNIGKESMT